MVARRRWVIRVAGPVLGSLLVACSADPGTDAGTPPAPPAQVSHSTAAGSSAPAASGAARPGPTPAAPHAADALPGSTTAAAPAPAAHTLGSAGGSTSSAGPRRSIASTITAPPAFRSSVRPIDATLAGRMAPSHRVGCPVPLADLRYLTVSYHGFDGRSHRGELVVSARVADDVVSVFKALYRQQFPIRAMRLVDDFGGSDQASMAADNTSAFNCRPITGGSSWSEHSYGEAIDLNPRENPYLSDGRVLPSDGAQFVDRPDSPGVIHRGDAVVAAFAEIGWRWGGSWTDPVDLQHFSRSGR